MDNNNLGVILKARRREKGLTLKQLSGLSGLHLSCVARIEKGERFPTGHTLRRLAEPLGFSEKELFKLAGFLSSDNTSQQDLSPYPSAPPAHVPLLSMLTAREVAVLLNVHINTVRRWGNRGILKAYRIGSRGDRRFRREDIDRFLQESRIGGGR